MRARIAAKSSAARGRGDWGGIVRKLSKQGAATDWEIMVNGASGGVLTLIEVASIDWPPWLALLAPGSPARLETALQTKPGDAIMAEGFLPLGKFFLGEHVAVVGFGPAKCSALNCEDNRSFSPSTPSCSRSGWRERAYKVNGRSHRLGECYAFVSTK
jgi:hypothetical protein